MTVTAAAGVTHEEALGFYLSNNIAPMAAPVPKKVTLVGAAATAAHVCNSFCSYGASTIMAKVLGEIRSFSSVTP